MPRVRRAHTVAAGVEAVWRIVADPRRLSDWWPGVERVEDATPEAWTTVTRSSKGKPIRADFTRTDVDAPRLLGWRQEVQESPFERFMASAETLVSLTPAGDRPETRVEIRARTRLRGLARLGSPIVRRATARRLDAALDGLGRLVGGAA